MKAKPRKKRVTLKTLKTRMAKRLLKTRRALKAVKLEPTPSWPFFGTIINGNIDETTIIKSKTFQP